LTSSAGKAEYTQEPMPPVPEALARRLIANEAGEKTSPEELAAAGESVYLRLRERLTILFGAAGFDALWARAMHLAQPRFLTTDGTPADEAAAPHAPRAYGLYAAVRGRNSVAAQHNLVVAFASFISLLFTFIGAELGFRFMRQIWPDLPPDAAAARAEEATQ
jgi:hypothetical protein